MHENLSWAVGAIRRKCHISRNISDMLSFKGFEPFGLASWRNVMAGSGEYEPKGSRNVTGTASTPDRRWTKQSKNVPKANGAPNGPEEASEETAEPVVFEPDPALILRIEKGEADRRKSDNPGKTKH